MTICQENYEAFNRKLTARLSGKRFPLCGTFELTWKCNFRCVHCYLGGCPPIGKPLSTNRILQLLDEMAEAGCLSLVWTGGEPLLHPGFKSVHRRAVHRGFLVAVFTNASRLDESLADFLADHPPRCLEVSLYGSDEASYREVTGTTGSFQRVQAGLDRLQQRSLPVVLKAILLKPLLPQVQAMREMALRRGLPLRFDPGVDPTLAGSLMPLGLRVDPEEAVGIELDDAERLRKLGPYDAHFRGRAPDGSAFVCGAGTSSFHIDPAGQLMPCLFLRRHTVDLRKEPFAAAFEKLGALRQVAPAGCTNCDLAHLCGFCPGLLELGEAAPDGNNHYHCRTARARADRVRIRRVAS